MLQTVNRARSDAELKGRLLAGLPELFEHGTYRRYLRGAALTDADLALLISEAEELAVALLIGDEA